VTAVGEGGPGGGVQRELFEKWTWAWEPKLGGIVVNATPVTVTFPLPDRFDPKSARGWIPK